MIICSEQPHATELPEKMRQSGEVFLTYLFSLRSPGPVYITFLVNVGIYFTAADFSSLLFVQIITINSTSGGYWRTAVWCFFNTALEVSSWWLRDVKTVMLKSTVWQDPKDISLVGQNKLFTHDAGLDKVEKLVTDEEGTLSFCKPRQVFWHSWENIWRRRSNAQN